MDICHDRSKGICCLSQSQYIEKALHQFYMSQTKPVSTPLAEHFKLSTSSGPLDAYEEMYMSKDPYACVVVTLMYAMVFTRLDIADVVIVVSHFMLKPCKGHWKVVHGSSSIFDAPTNMVWCLIKGNKSRTSCLLFWLILLAILMRGTLSLDMRFSFVGLVLAGGQPYII